MARRIRHLFERLTLDPREIPASNVGAVAPISWTSAYLIFAAAVFS
jgi:hypothetical protein